MSGDRWLTTGDVARRLDVMPATVQDLDRQGRLKAIRTLGGKRLFREADVEAFIQERTQRRLERASMPRHFPKERPRAAGV